MTPLDQAYARMQSAPEDDALRLRFYERLLDAELFLLLRQEPVGDTVEPALFDLEEGRFALIFDRPDRLAEFAEGAAPFVALAGRHVVAMLTGQDTGLGLNLGVAPSEMLLPADAVAWLSDQVATTPPEAEAQVDSILPPGDLPEDLLRGLDAKLAAMGGLAHSAYLARVTYRNGAIAHVLAIVSPLDGAEPAIARAVQEVLQFTDMDAASLDVMFIRPSDPIAGQMARFGLRFDLPDVAEQHPLAAPGSDPAKPPKLK